jgi:hypothetical protein
MLAGTPARADGDSKGNRADQPEEDDFTSTPYTRYGEFNSEKDEQDDTNFFQNGRFFGISLGTGYEAVTGNRGQLWQGGFPLLDFKLLYWFSFNFAMDMDLYWAQHFYQDTQVGTATVNMVHLGIDLRYYFDTKDLSSAISFANPYITGGIGSYTATANSSTEGAQSADTEMGGDLGFGFEFALNPHKTYLDADVKVNYFVLQDTYAPQSIGSTLPDLTGLFVTFTISVLFTW